MTYDNIKSHKKKQDFTLSFLKIHFLKKHRGEGQIDPQVVLGLKNKNATPFNTCLPKAHTYLDKAGYKLQVCLSMPHTKLTLCDKGLIYLKKRQPHY